MPPIIDVDYAIHTFTIATAIAVTGFAALRIYMSRAIIDTLLMPLRRQR